MKKKLLILSFPLLVLLFTISCNDESTETELIQANGFSAEISGLEVQFRHNSTGATSYEWDFGDNNNSTEENPKHTYSGYGTYNVTLIMRQNDESLEESKEIVISKDNQQVSVKVDDIKIESIDTSFTKISVTIQLPEALKDEQESIDIIYASSIADLENSTLTTEFYTNSNSESATAVVSSLTPGTKYYFKVSHSKIAESEKYFTISTKFFSVPSDLTFKVADFRYFKTITPEYSLANYLQPVSVTVRLGFDTNMSTIVARYKDDYNEGFEMYAGEKIYYDAIFKYGEDSATTSSKLLADFSTMPVVGDFTSVVLATDKRKLTFTTDNDTIVMPLNNDIAKGQLDIDKANTTWTNGMTPIDLGTGDVFIYHETATHFYGRTTKKVDDFLQEFLDGLRFQGQADKKYFYFKIAK